LEVPSCPCVLAARRISVLPIPDKFETEGSGVSDNTVYAIGYVIVKCGYCGTVLKAENGIEIR
jgi:hypothetical protein